VNSATRRPLAHAALKLSHVRIFQHPDKRGVKEQRQEEFNWIKLLIPLAVTCLEETLFRQIPGMRLRQIVKKSKPLTR